MSETGFWLSFVAFATITLTLLFARVRAARRVFEIGASLLGLPSDAVSGSIFLTIKGQIGGFSVLVRQRSLDERDSSTTIEVGGARLIPPELILGREGMGTSLGKLLVGQDIATGDEWFDKAVLVRGQTSRTLALLDQETRARSVALVRNVGKVAGGTISLTIHERLSDGGALAGRVRTVLDLAERLARRDPVVERLAANARHDPVAGVRHRNLQELVASFPEHLLTRETLKAALTDPSSEVRLLAAVSLGAEGLDCLRSIVEDCETPEAVALEAVGSLGEHLPCPMALTRLEAAMPAGHLQLANALVERLGASTEPDAVEKLVEHLAGGPPALAAACARALARSGSATVEPALLAALSNPSPDVRIAAAEALGVAGSVNSVAALHEAARSTLLTPGVRLAALGAVAQIQARLSGAAPGQLALSENEAGAVALADSPVGAVSLAEPAGGSASLSDPIEREPAVPVETSRRATPKRQRRPERQ